MGKRSFPRGGCWELRARILLEHLDAAAACVCRINLRLQPARLAKHDLSMSFQTVARFAEYVRALAVLIGASLLSSASLSAPNPTVFPLSYAPAPVDNPLKGFVPYVGQAKEFPHSLEFSYLPLASVMTGPASFDWKPLEQLLDGVAARGCQLIVRFYLEYPGKPTGVPEFLLKDGLRLRAWTNSNTQPLPPSVAQTPDYEDTRLRAALTRFITAFGARYDGDPRLGYVTAGLLGTWGEWHCYPHTEWFASREVQTEVMDAYEAAFHKTPILLRYPAGDNEASHAPNGRRKFGYHDDSFAWATLETGRKEDGWYYLSALRQAGAMDRWRTAPIGGEIRPELWPCLWKATGCAEGQDFAVSVRETHATWLMDSSVSGKLSPDERLRALAAARSLGYELQVLQASATLAGRSLEVSVTLANRGVAPFYANWPVRVAVAGPTGERMLATLPLQLSALLPGSPPLIVRGTLENVASGKLLLLLGVENPLPKGRSLRFANVGQDLDQPGWLTLGTMMAP